MNFFENIIYSLQMQMNTPKPYGWFHLMWIAFTIIALVLLFKIKNKYSEKQLKVVLGVYGIIALILEITKQIMWSFNYDEITKMFTWDYQWYAAPFQLCTTPIFVSVICLFMKDSKLRNFLLSYMSYVTILGGLLTILIPDSCFTRDTLINIHTMWLHCGSFVVSIYLIMNNAVKINKQSFKGAFTVFLVFVLIAEIMNIGIYNLGILNGETFNMFYISPYFISSLPVFNVIQESVPFIVFLFTYILGVFIGAFVVYFIARKIKVRNGEKEVVDMQEKDVIKDEVKKHKKSGPAIFMYSVIAVTLITSIVCFVLYYKNIYNNKIILWTGITTFTIMYHFWVRIIMGNVSKLFKKHINYNQWWFKERSFEKGLYKMLRVKEWKGKALTYNPETFSLKENSLEQIANTMTKSEVDHWINEVISITTIFFSIIWGQFFIFFITALAAMIFDSQFIIIQRYNRPRIIKVLERSKKEIKKKGVVMN